MRINATMRALDQDRGVVRVEDVYDTSIEDLWQACTSTERLARWIAEVTGDLRLGGEVHAVFTSTWSGQARIDSCDAPSHLLVTMEPGADDETQVEAWLTAEGSRTRLVVEERGLPVGALPAHGAGWQAHLEDLGRSLVHAGPVHEDGWSEHAPAVAWRERWSELTAAYQDAHESTTPS
ncbi:hypothetical protein ASG76_02635 [Nocardioides sp. Soil774]|uniref:SRPBCC domain-containing protein n=1 Tax=Nocardioides sp. Soil774 TaxID=1736408 RepID=UPI0006FA4FB0|nr:SRPBCC domain-containing protein [Nocardioides sp. Soil774]KRE95976.1 hypothetical protein ASG76_02635 [Nocardioides sp. Soil774]